MSTNSGHYLGTVVLVQNSTQSYEVVDGQQRLTTLSLIINALLEELPPTDADRIGDERILLKQNSGSFKLDFGVNTIFVTNMLAGLISPASSGQRKLNEVYLYCRDRAQAISSSGGSALIKQWLNTIKTLEIIQFVATNTGNAIRMFQTVNDRGLPLTAMDKAKALLVYYSYRYLKGALDSKINNSFGICFSSFDSIREFVRKSGYKIENIDRDTFSEDSILRYHYLSYNNALAINATDYEGSLRTVFDGFLKGTLKQLCNNPTDLNAFIDDYVSDLSEFSKAFNALVSETATNDKLYKIFIVLGLAARLYPLIIRLKQRNILFSQIPGTAIDLLHAIEVCDVRIYKTRGTDPAKDIGDLSHKSRLATIQDIATDLRLFITNFMPDGIFQTRLGQDMYQNGANFHMLLEYDEKLAGAKYPHSSLVNLVTNQITREHIFAQTPNFSVTSQGFIDDIDYQNHVHNFGNLTLLTKSENSRCNNKSVHVKLTDPSMFSASVYAGTRQIAQLYMVNGSSFTKTDVTTRTNDLTVFSMLKWCIW